MFRRAADLGCAQAIGELGLWSLRGLSDLVPDREKAKEYFEDSAKKGDVHSRHNLAMLLMEEDKYDLAIKHWHLGAVAGHDESMESLWYCFSKGKLSKPDLEKALRAYKAASDEMSSEDRERFDAYQDAFAGSDDFLKNIYRGYYTGFINAKELNKAIKAYRAGDRLAVLTLLRNKVLAAGDREQPRATM